MQLVLAFSNFSHKFSHSKMIALNNSAFLPKTPVAYGRRHAIRQQQEVTTL